MPSLELLKFNEGLSMFNCRTVTFALWIAGCLSAVCDAGGAVDPSERPMVMVGVAEIDITPDYPVRLAGYGSRTAESRGVAHRIRANALAIGGDDRSAVVLVTVENRGVMGDIVYACHCTTLDPGDNLISGDWAGFAQKDLEAKHPGATALLTIGCGADANPAPRTSTEAAQAHGRASADEVERLLEGGTWQALPGPPTACFRVISLPLDPPPSRDEFLRVARSGGALARNASYQLAKLDRGEPLQDAIAYRIQTWCFDDKLAMVFLAGEVVVDYATRLRNELDGTRLWITAYTNDRPCYIPSERVLREGGYEGGGDLPYAAIPSRLQPGLEDRIARCVRELIPDQFRAPGAHGAKDAW